MTPNLRNKTLAFASFVILSNAFGNLFLSLGMRQSTASDNWVTQMFQPQAMLGIALLVAWLLARMAMLSWADLTYVLPVTAFGYVVSAALGMWFQAEVINGKRWIGIACIVLGVVLVGSGDAHREPSK
jgi:drug/metabolite transporter (DMT)-like permease